MTVSKSLLEPPFLSDTGCKPKVVNQIRLLKSFEGAETCGKDHPKKISIGLSSSTNVTEVSNIAAWVPNNRHRRDHLQVR